MVADASGTNSKPGEANPRWVTWALSAHIPVTLFRTKDGLGERMGGALGIFILAALWTLVLPGAVAHHNDVWNSDGVKAKMCHLVETSACRKDEARKVMVRALELGAIEERLEKDLRAGPTNPPAPSDNTVAEDAVTRDPVANGSLAKKEAPNSDAHRLYARSKKSLDVFRATSPSFSILGFVESNSTYYYFISYIALALHLCVTVRSTRARAGFGAVAAYTLGSYVLWASGNWVRNFLLDDHESRAIFSFVHFDISPPSFVLQEARTFGLCFLHAWAWALWVELARANDSYLRTWRMPAERQAQLQGLQNLAVYTGTLLDRWQVHSFLLTCAFLPWTLFYWTSAGGLGDKRYYTSALCVHLLWALGWWCISYLPLRAMAAWSQNRVQVLSELASTKGESSTFELAASLAPMSTFRLASTAAAAIIAMLSPLLSLAQ